MVRVFLDQLRRGTGVRGRGSSHGSVEGSANRVLRSPCWNRNGKCVTVHSARSTRRDSKLREEAALAQLRHLGLHVPGGVDTARYLARTNIQAQQTGEPAPPDAPDNLFEPVDADEDHGSHGPFDDRAHDSSPAQIISRHRGKIVTGLGLAAAGWAASRRATER